MARRAMRTILTNLALIALFALLCRPSSSANCLDTSQISDEYSKTVRLDYLFLISDFDGDRQIDQAEPHSIGSHHCIRVRFGSSRETHLDLGALGKTSGALLTWDINHDKKPDLIWISHSGAEQSIAWIGDGRGNFSRSDLRTDDPRLNALVSVEGNPEIFAGSGSPNACCTLDPDPVELSHAARQMDAVKTPPLAECNHRPDLRLYLSCLRERGPPCHTSIV